MPATSATVTDEDLLEAFVLLQRYSLELDRVAANALGQGPTGSVDLEILLAIARAGDASPSGLVEVLGMPRSTLARGLARLRRATARFGLTEAPDRHAVVHLALRDSRPSLIAEHINLTPAGTTSLLDRLEALGLVERRTGLWPADRRAVLVRLTPSGRRAAGALLEVFRRHQDAVLDAVGASLGLAPSEPGQAS